MCGYSTCKMSLRGYSDIKLSWPLFILQNDLHVIWIYPKLSDTHRFCSIGNFFFAGARIFFQSLDAAIFLFSRVSDIPSESQVLPVISTNDRLTLGCELWVWLSVNVLACIFCLMAHTYHHKQFTSYYFFFLGKSVFSVSILKIISNVRMGFLFFVIFVTFAFLSLFVPFPLGWDGNKGPEWDFSPNQWVHGACKKGLPSYILEVYNARYFFDKILIIGLLIIKNVYM